jgi:hypothetical protein
MQAAPRGSSAGSIGHAGAKLDGGGVQIRSGGDSGRGGAKLDGGAQIRSGGDSGRGQSDFKPGKVESFGNKAPSERNFKSENNVRSNGSDIQASSFLDKHGQGGGRDGGSGKQGGGGGKQGSDISAGRSDREGKGNKESSAELKSSNASTNVKSGKGSSSGNDLRDGGRIARDRDSDSFLKKHGGDKISDRRSNDGPRDRNDGVARNGRGDGHHDWDHDGRGWHDWHRHHFHRSSFFVGIGIGSPFFGYGFYNPFWWGGWPYYGGWGPYYPGGFSIGYASRHFGFMYGTGFGYGYASPYYMYDPCCAYPETSTYVLDSPAYAALPSSSAAIATDVATTDAPPMRISTRSKESNYIPPRLDPTAETSSTDFARQGELAFRDREYKQAAREWRHALLDDPQNGTLVLMMAQALFQTGEYNEAAGAVQAGLQMMPPDKWDTVIGNYKELYSDTLDYVDQLKALEKAVKDKPKEPGLRLLVGYHYLFLGYPNEALRELKIGDELVKTDQAMKELIKLAEDQLKKRQGDGPPVPAEPPQKPDVQ